MRYTVTVNEAHQIITRIEKEDPETFAKLRKFARSRLHTYDAPIRAVDISDEVLSMVRHEDYLDLIRDF